MNIVTDIPKLCFSSQLDEIVASDAVHSLSFSIWKADGSLIFEESLVADTNRYIIISEVNNILEPYLLESPLMDVIFVFEWEENKVEYFSRIILSRAVLGANTRMLLHQRFLSTLTGDKDTLPSSREFLYAYGIKKERYSVNATYRNNNTDEYEHVVIIGSELAIDAINTLDVSPRKFSEDNKTLVKYTVICGVRRMTYYVDNLYNNPLLELIFTNNFGLPDTFSIKGVLQSDDGYNSQFGKVRGRYKKFKSELDREYVATTDVLSQDIARWLGDNLFTSLSVFELRDGLPQTSITITDQTVKRSSDDSELPSFEFKYKLEQRNHLLYNFNKYLESVWSKEFNKIFRGNDTYK